VPHIESAQEREKVVRFSKYAPVGARGFSPYTRAGHFQSRPNHTQLENERTLVAIMIESPEALSAIERIMDDPVVDVVYIGTYDISCALGLAGQVSHPKVMDLLTKAVQKINKAGKAAGCMVNSVEDGQKFRQLGIRFLLYDVDAHVLQKDYARFKEGMGANSPGRPKGSKRTD
jgi:4-hydroxy-2-oxoheptanedioate aldolase